MNTATLQRVLLPMMLLAALLAIGSKLAGWAGLHYASKPAVLAVAIIFVAVRARHKSVKARFTLWLLLAQTASLAGDVWLMLPGDFFIAGLASFLLAHFAYIALLRHGVTWWPRRGALAALLLYGATMYAVLYGALGEPVLRGAVAIYVAVIALMAAQALGRAAVLGTLASRRVALGACLFVISDTLLAIDRFLQPLPLAPLWILGSYFAAQILIAANAEAPR